MIPFQDDTLYLHSLYGHLPEHASLSAWSQGDTEIRNSYLNQIEQKNHIHREYKDQNLRFKVYLCWN